MPKEVFYKISEQKRDKLLLSAVKAFTADEYDELTVSKLTSVMNILRTDFYYYFKDKEDVMEPVKEYIFSAIEQNGVPKSANDAIYKLFSNISLKTKPKMKQYYAEVAKQYSPACVTTFTNLLIDRYENGEKTVIKEIKINSKIRLLAELVEKYFSKKITREEALELLNQ